MIMKSILRIFTVLAVCFVTFSAEGAEQFVNFNGDGWLLNKDGKVGVFVDGSADKGVVRAAQDLCYDLERVCGAKCSITGQAEGAQIVVSVDPKMKATEKFILQISDGKVSVTGSDKRGAIYGIYEISRQIGVSPWYYWADVPVEHHGSIYLCPGTYTDGEPAVRYRGIFLNDEAPCLTSWVKNTFGTNYGGHEFYAKMRRYMKPGGLWVQWIQTYEFNDQLFLNILKALDVTFPYVSLYKAPEEPDIIIIASDQPVIQKSIERFSTDPALVKEFERIHRDPEFFGERNFLFTSKMVRNMMKNIDPNSIFTPMVDNKAEEARFVHSEAHIVQVFDSCEICWPEYLDSADYALRRPAKVKAMMEAMAGDSYRKLGIEAYLAKVDTPVVERSPEWKKFREEYIEWVRGVPMEARDTNAVYMKVRDLVNAGMFPASFVDEFNILEVARTKNYAVAAKLVADFYEKYEVKDMDEFFLRNAILIAFLANEPELADVLYKEAIRPHESFFKVEKLLIAKEIPNLRRKVLKRAE